MKLKQRAEDFQVAERTDLLPGQGPHALYRLEKRGWSTPDALALVRRRWKIDARRLSFGGLKDRHAATVQHFTVFHGPQRNLAQQDVRVTYLGQVAQPFTSTDIRSNGFRITLRDIDVADLAGIETAVTALRADGVPNYFDDQRFGSVAGESGEFIGRLLVQGRFEEALRLALTGPYEFDRAEEKRAKALLRQHWGDWSSLRGKLPPGDGRRLVSFLADRPSDFRGALARLPSELRSLYLAAYQSHLWNRMLARWLEQHCRPDQFVAVRLRLGSVPFPRALDPDQRSALATLQLPLPSARLKLAADDPLAPLVEAVLAKEGFELRQMQVKGIREFFFSKGDRAALCQPRELNYETAPDEFHPGRHKAVLSFELPRGSYATLLVKRVQQHRSAAEQHG